MKLLVSKVTAPLGTTAPASALPFSIAPVVTVIDVFARMVPWNVVPVPIVAELPTSQKTLEAWAPLASMTLPTVAVVMRVEPIWKIQTAFVSPCASRVRSPDIIASDDAAVYTPGRRMCPPRSPDTAVPAGTGAL